MAQYCVDIWCAVNCERIPSNANDCELWQYLHFTHVLFQLQWKLPRQRPPPTEQQSQIPIYFWHAVQHLVYYLRRKTPRCVYESGKSLISNSTLFIVFDWCCVHFCIHTNARRTVYTYINIDPTMNTMQRYSLILCYHLPA